MLIKIMSGNPKNGCIRRKGATRTTEANGDVPVVIHAQSVCVQCDRGAEGAPVEIWERCTLHGIQELATAKELYKKVFWAVAFVAALSMAIYGCYMIVTEFLKQPVVVSYVVQDPEVKDGGAVQLPDIIICPFNRLNKSYLKEMDVPDNLTDFIQMAYGFGTPYEFHHEHKGNLILGKPPNHNYTELFNTSARETDALLERLNMTFAELLENASPACPSTIDHCAMGDRVLDCCAGAQSIIVGSGRCYRLSGEEQIQAGYGFGLTIVIRLQENVTTPAVNNLHNDGVMVKLAERGKGHDFDVTFLPLGTHALMPLRATKYKFLHYPPTYECVRANDTVEYSRIGCFESCMFEESYAECNCQHVASVMKRYATCSTTQAEWCMWPAARRIWGPDWRQKVAECKKKCKAPCEYWHYMSSVSYAKFPSETIRRYVRDDETWKRYQTMIVLDVFYERLEYTVIEHYPRMTPHTFIANIGGQIGLWVGGSILTLLQVCVYIFRSIERLVRRTAAHAARCTHAADRERVSVRVSSTRMAPPAEDQQTFENAPKLSPTVESFDSYGTYSHPLHCCFVVSLLSPQKLERFEPTTISVESLV